MKQYPFLLVLAIILLFFFPGCDVGKDYTVGGQILLEDDTPLEGVEVYLDWLGYSDMKFTVHTNDAGWYSHKYDSWFTKDPIIIFPSDPAYIFSPLEYDFLTGLGGDQLELNFTAIPIEKVQM